jgi:hypothetical protein
MDWNVIVSVGSALVSIGVAAGAAAAKGSTSARDTALPPPPSQPAGVSQAQLDSVVRRLEGVETRLDGLEGRERQANQGAGEFRTQVLERLARIAERLRLKEPGHGGPRGSDG